MKPTAYLVLENGQIFQGEFFGAIKEVTGEVVFTTGMVSYLETLTDPRYFGQIVVQTFPLIGNYGVIPEDFQRDAMGPKAYIVKDWCQVPSNFRAKGELGTFFTQQGLAAVKGIDTRSVTKALREKGSMNGIITSDLKSVNFESMKGYRVQGAVGQVSVKEIDSLVPAQENLPVRGQRRKVAVVDCGLMEMVTQPLLALGAELTVCPWDTGAQEIARLDPDGILLSGGPGDPREDPRMIRRVQEMIALNLPVFGVGLGHQLLALAQGMTVKKLKYGHRGENLPVKDRETGKLWITGQNHGYAVAKESIPREVSLWFTNLNDGSCEGLRYRDIPALSVQFNPQEAQFRAFAEMMEKGER